MVGAAANHLSRAGNLVGLDVRQPRFANRARPLISPGTALLIGVMALVGNCLPGHEARAEDGKIVSEDVLYCPDIELDTKYQEHVKGIIAKRQDICKQTKMESYPEIEDFFGLKFGENEALDEFRTNEYAHYPELLPAKDLARVQEFAAKVRKATASMRSRYPLRIQPKLKVRSFHRGEKGIIEVTLEAPSQDYKLTGELKNVGGAEHLFLSVTRPSDQQLFVSQSEKGPISTEVETNLPLPSKVTIQWRTLMAPIPYDLAYQPLGQLGL